MHFMPPLICSRCQDDAATHQYIDEVSFLFTKQARATREQATEAAVWEKQTAPKQPGRAILPTMDRPAIHSERTLRHPASRTDALHARRYYGSLLRDSVPAPKCAPLASCHDQ